MATEADLDAAAALDQHVAPDELRDIVRRGRALVADDAAGVVGWLRWGLFWDEIPFMNMLVVAPERRGHGVGTALIQHWERECSDAGYGTVMTSTLSNERAQHLYRRLGYLDCGVLLLPGEAAEILLRKELPGRERPAAARSFL